MDTTCHFLRLPPELRVQIYEYIVLDDPYDPQYIGEWFQWAMLRISRLIRQEALPIYHIRLDQLVEMSLEEVREVTEELRLLRRGPLRSYGDEQDLEDAELAFRVTREQHDELVETARLQKTILFGCGITVEDAKMLTVVGRKRQVAEILGRDIDTLADCIGYCATRA